MPQCLCLYCYEKLENFHYFYSQVERNQNALHTPQPIILNVNRNDVTDIPECIKIAISKNFNNFQNNILYKIEDVEITVSNENKEQLDAQNHLEQQQAHSNLIVIPSEDEQKHDNLIVIPNEDENVQKYQQEHHNLIDIPNKEDEPKFHPSEHQLVTMQGYEIKIPPLVKISAPQKIKIEPPALVTAVKIKKEKTKKINKKLKKRNLPSDNESDFESDCSSIFNDESDEDSDDDFSGMGYNGDFSKFPDKIIQDTKLLIRGKKLMFLMSKFYRLDCDLCDDDSKKTTFKLLSSLLEHYSIHHSVKGYVLCCDAKLVKPRAMAMHMSRHLQPDAFKCPSCEKMMTCPKILQYHIQNHLPEEQRPLVSFYNITVYTSNF